jgi:hypothetical protein
VSRSASSAIRGSSLSGPRRHRRRMPTPAPPTRGVPQGAGRSRASTPTPSRRWTAAETDADQRRSHRAARRLARGRRSVPRGAAPAARQIRALRRGGRGRRRPDRTPRRVRRWWGVGPLSRLVDPGARHRGRRTGQVRVDVEHALAAPAEHDY